MKLPASILELIKKLISSGLLRSSVYISLSKVFSSACNLIFMIYAVNILSKPENGQFQYYLGFLPVFLSIAEFGLPNAIIKYLSPRTEDKSYIGNILSSSLVIKTISFISLCFIALGLTLFVKLDPLIMFLLVSGGFLVSFISFFESIFISFSAYYALSSWNPLANLFRLLILYFVNRYSDYNLSYIDILGIFTLSPLFSLFLFFFLFKQEKLYWSAPIAEIKKCVKELSLFNTWAFVASIFAIISDRMEIFILKQYHPPEFVAVYGTALQLFAGFVIIFSTLNSMVLPGLSRLAGTEEFKSYLLRSVLVGLGMALLLSPGYFLAEPIFTLLYNNKYTESIGVFKILYPNYLLQLIFAPFGIGLFALGKVRILAILAFLRMFFGFILDNLLIPEFGVVGAGISFFLGQIISWLVLIGYFWAMFWR
ncbi:MAG: oligosaccharide flippase family protein [Leptospiraceae bacterium]|nr:oligosaccharide flippase family protein [Leptospiraceae bacterium]